MSDYSTVPRELAEFLHQERHRVLPFIGAGVSVRAGVPAAEGLAALIAARARDEGADVEEDADFATVCAVVSQELGHLRLQEITAAIIEGLEVAPTPLQRLIVRAPLGVVVTTNFDNALSLAAVSAGLTPLVRTPHEAAALDTPGEGEVVIVHLHGNVVDPAGMVLPGASMDALATNEAFKTVLRGLVIDRAVMYLGYRLPPEDAYLRAEIETMSTMFADRGPHRLLLPLEQRETRRAELATLEPFGVAVDSFDSNRGYQAVDQAALLIAPSSIVEGAETLARVRDAADYYLPPQLLPEDRERDRSEPDNRLLIAQLGFGDDSIKSPVDLVAARRAVVIAEPGMGKTQLLYHLGTLDPKRVPLVLKLAELVAELQPNDEPDRVLAAALSRARAFFEEGVRRPTRDGLDGNAYTLLFDALDEVASDRRADAIALLSALADRYPQHVMVVTSRINDDVFALEPWFEILRIPRDAAWGRHYLEQRGIPDERVRHLFEEVQTVADLLAVPQYAALIGERLAQEPLEPIPATGFALMIEVGVKDVVGREAEKLGYTEAQLYGWLRLLALSLELRGRLSASIEELAEIPGPQELRNADARERLVERALLQDVPDVAALQTNAVQEALAADALLAMDDPVAALTEACTTTLVGEPVFRADLDHMIDLFYEGAPTDIRPALRVLDPLRWARTTRADAPRQELEEALDALWDLYVERRVWLDTNQGREVRDARSAVVRLIRAIGDVGDERRRRWTEATRSDEPTARANGSFFLLQLGFDEAAPNWLEPLLADDNSVVRRHAASAAAEFGDAGRVLLPAVSAAYSTDTDELAAEGLGMTIFELTPLEQRGRAIELLTTNAIGWGRINHLLLELPLEEALAVLERTGVRNESDERHLAEIATKVPPEDWSDDQVATLVRLLLRSHRIFYREFAERELVEELARTHPRAALTAVREAAPEDVNWNDLSFLQRIPADVLRAAAEGPLEAPLTTLLEILEMRAAHAGEPAPPPEQPPAPEPPSLAEILDDGSLEARAKARIPRPLLESYGRQVADLNAGRREQLAAVVEQLWPDEPLGEVVTVDRNSGRAPAGFDAALAFATALHVPLDEERWFEIFETRAVFFWWSATEWLRRHSEAVDEARVVVAFGNFATEFEVRQALSCLASVTGAVADAAASALIRINSIDSIFMLRDFRERGQLEVLARLRDEAQAPEIRRAAQRELAAAGDVEAQRAELLEMRREIAAEPHAYDHEGFPWATTAQPEVIDDLAALLREIAEAPAGDRSGVDRSIQIALAATGDELALRAYDDIIEDASIESGSFFRYQRDQLARQIARDDALARLPERLSEVARWAIERGLDI